MGLWVAGMGPGQTPHHLSIKREPNMMNSNPTSKIVIGIGVAVVFGVAVSIFAVRAKHASELARNAPSPALAAQTGQNAADATASAQSAAAPTPTDQTASSPSAPPAVPPVAAPPSVARTAPTTSNVAKDAAGTPPSDDSKPATSKGSDRADRHVAKTRTGGGTSGTRVASAANPNTSPALDSASKSTDSVKSSAELAPAASSSDAASSGPVGATADTQQAPAQTGQEAASSAGPAAMSNEPVASDSQITATVKSEIASAAPNSNVDVTTTNGVVALAGSVPSQAAVDQARQAAQRVAGVKHVDASALMVSNQ
jgi:hyperosmotically inducible periplasmic protein